MYKYPEFLKKEEGKGQEKVETYKLSTTARVKARHDRKVGKEEGAATPAVPVEESKGDKEMVDEEKKKEEEEAAIKLLIPEVEPDT